MELITAQFDNSNVVSDIYNQYITYPDWVKLTFTETNGSDIVFDSALTNECFEDETLTTKYLFSAFKLEYNQKICLWNSTDGLKINTVQTIVYDTLYKYDVTHFGLTKAPTKCFLLDDVVYHSNFEFGRDPITNNITTLYTKQDLSECWIVKNGEQLVFYSETDGYKILNDVDIASVSLYDQALLQFEIDVTGLSLSEIPVLIYTIKPKLDFSVSKIENKCVATDIPLKINFEKTKKDYIETYFMQIPKGLHDNVINSEYIDTNIKLQVPIKNIEFDFLEYKYTWYKIVDVGMPPKSRYGHSSILFENQMIIFGGFDVLNYFNDIHSFNLTNYSWSELYPRNPFVSPEPRYLHGTALVNDRMYIFGGKGKSETLDDFWYFSFYEENWVKIELPPDSEAIRPGKRHSCCMNVIGNDIYIFGGTDGSGNILNDFWKYNITDNKFVQLNIPNNLEFSNGLYNSSMLIIDKKIYIIGGSDKYETYITGGYVCDTETIDEDNNTSWTQLYNLNLNITNHIALKMDSDNIIIFSGYRRSTDSGYIEYNPTNKIYLYNLKNNSLSEIIPDTVTNNELAAKRYLSSGIYNANDGKMYIFDGTNKEDALLSFIWTIQIKPCLNINTI